MKTTNQGPDVVFDELMHALEQVDPVEGVTPIDVLDLPDPLGRVFGHLVRKGWMTSVDLAAEMGLQEYQARQVAELMVRKGFLLKEARDDENQPATRPPVYRPYFVRMRKRDITL